MKEATQQAIMTLSRSMQQMANQAAEKADFPKLYEGHILRMTDDGMYDVAMGNQIATLPVYGKGLLKPGQFVYVVSPYNSKELSQFWILAPGGGGSGDGTGDSSELYDLVLQLRRECSNKLDKGALVQETGQSETSIMSQKAVTDAIAASGTSGSGVQGVRVGANKLVPDSENIVTVPVAKIGALGVVRSQTGQNCVSVDVDGYMEVDSLDPMRLEQNANDVLILDCGDSRGW